MIELVGGEAGDGVDLLSVGEGLASEGLVPKQAPPAYLEIEPASTFLPNSGLSSGPAGSNRPERVGSGPVGESGDLRQHRWPLWRAAVSASSPPNHL